MSDQGETDEALDAIRSSGGRITSTKRSVIEILAKANEHLSTEAVTAAIHETTPGVAPSTIYRILEELVRLQVIEHSHAGRGPVTYHLGSHEHGHLVCQQCGAIIEAEPELFEALTSLSLRQHDFIVDAHHFAVLGTCASCASGNSD
jgi:Fur family ferric uptake transcriptional regulator